MHKYTLISVCFVVLLAEVISVEVSRLQKRSLCTSNCRNRCEDSDCSANCASKCSRPCNRRCENSENCQPNPVECEQQTQEKTRETIVLPSGKQSDSINRNTNHVNNDYKVDINPNITMTNTITNVNNISVPINVTSVNVNNIRVTSTDTRRTDTNIASAPYNCSGSRSPNPACDQTRRRIVIVPFPTQTSQKQEIQYITPPPQVQRIQPVLQQPLIMAPSQQFLPPVQTQQMIIPIPVSAPVQRSEYIQSFIEPQIYNVPDPAQFNQQQLMWYPRQQIVSQQEFIPQQQNVFPIQQNMLPISQAKPCTSSFSNSPCSQQGTVNYNQPCTTSECLNRYPYVMTSPFYGLPQFSNANQYSSLNGYMQNQFVPYLNSGSIQTTQNSNRI